MNAEVAYGYRERKAHAEAMGEVAHRLHCLQHLKLKTVIKVSIEQNSTVTLRDAILAGHIHYYCNICNCDVEACHDFDESQESPCHLVMLFPALGSLVSYQLRWLPSLLLD